MSVAQGAPPEARLQETPGRVRRATDRLADIARAQPLSVVVAGILVVLAFVSGSALKGPPDRLRDVIGAGIAERTNGLDWLGTLGSILFSSGLPELVATVAAVLVLVGAAERRMGWRKALLAYVVTGVVATVVGVAVQAVGLAVGEVWSIQVAADSTLHPFTPALGTIMAASAFARPLWRRRIRVLGFAGITAFLLYDGHPSGLYALVGALAGLGLGRILRAADRLWTRSSHHEARVLLSSLVAITALGPVVTLLTRAPVGILAPLGQLFAVALPGRPLSAYCARSIEEAERTGLAASAACTNDAALVGLHGPGTLLLSILPLVALLVAARLIRRGRRLAVVVAVAVNLLLALLAGIYFALLPLTPSAAVARHGNHAERLLLSGLSVVAPLGVAVVLVVFLHHFTVRTPVRALRRYGWTLAGTFLALSAVFILAGTVGRDEFTTPVTLVRLLVSAPERFVPVGFLGARHLGPLPVDGPLRLVFEWIGPVFWVVLIVGLVVAAGASTRGGSAQERVAIDRILRRGVTGGLSHMATWEGNSYWFTPDGEAAVAYRVVGNIALTTGDPLCGDDRSAEVVLAFARWCDDRGLVPVFYSVRDDLAPVFRDLGWSTLPVGEETVLRPGTFAMQGKKWQDVRSSVNRAAKLGVRAEWTRYADLRPAIARQIEDISEQWVAEKDLPEMGFTLGGLDELMDRDVALMLAIDEADRVLAVTSWLPTYRDGAVTGWTLDFMRRLPDGMNGVMEFLIASVALRSKEEGLEFVSLSAAPLTSSEPVGGDASQAERLMSFLARVLEPAYGFQSLLTFKMKFQPEFTPLLMAYPDPLQLPAIGTALARAYLPELSVRQVPRLLRSVTS